MGEARRRQRHQVDLSLDDSRRMVIAHLGKIARGDAVALSQMIAAARHVRDDTEASGRAVALENALGAVSDQIGNARAGISAEDLAAARAGAVRLVESNAAFLGRTTLDLVRRAVGPVDHFVDAAATWAALIGQELQLGALGTLRAEIEDLSLRFSATLDQLERAAQES